MDIVDQPSSPDVESEDRSCRHTRSRWRSGIAAHLGVALLASALTTFALWAAGAFDRTEIRITEVIETREIIEVPASPELPATGADPVTPSPTSSHPPLTTDIAALAPNDLVAVVASRAIPSIVTIQSIDGEGGIAGSGSGVVIRPDGFVVTNDHVISDAAQLKVIMSDGLSYPAELVGTDPLMDIAVLKVGAADLTYIEFGSMEDLRTGEAAIAVGNPLGLDGGPSVTAGVISAFDRSLVTNFMTGDTLYGLLQTDAPITRGSSGGALLDVHGRLLGITTAIGLSDVGAEGLGFAVPVNLVSQIVDDLISEGAVSHAFLGIRGSSAFAELEAGVESPLGVEINLLDDSAIGESGAEDGDVIVALDGAPVRSMPLLVARLRGYRAGDQVEVTLQRNGDTLDIEVILDTYPS